MTSGAFRDLPVWRKSAELVQEVYKISSRFPREERYGITSQLRRAAVSVTSNIAEGSGRGTTPDLRNFLSIARGSVKEAESLILIGLKLKFIAPADAQKALLLAEEVSQMLVNFRAFLLQRSKRT